MPIELTTHLVSTNWQLVSTYVVPVISIGMSYFIGRLQSAISQKQKVLELRYKETYLPALKVLLEYGYWKVQPHEAHKSIVRDLIPALEEHLELLDSSSAIAYSNFTYALFSYKVALGIRQDSFASIRKGEHIVPFKIPEKDVQDYAETFIKLINSLFAEASRLSIKLKFPDLAATISRKYDVQNHL